MDRNRSYEDRKKSGLFRIFPPKTASFRFKTAKRAERPSASTAIHRQPIAGPGFFPIFATVSFHKRTTRKPNDIIRKILLSVALLSAGGALHAQPKVIAHRGYWTAPGSAQNSLASFAKADSIGVYGSEMDVWLTGDDKLVVNHDQVYKGTDIDMARARARDITRIVLPNGENLPTLDEYLEAVAARPATRLVLETKTLVPYRREDIAVEKIVRALERHGLTERTDFISFSLNACLEYRKRLPEANVYYLAGDLSPESLRRVALTGLDYSAGVLRQHPEWIEQAHRAGLEVNVWTVNSEEEMRYFIAQGVDYITTDYPERLQALLRE